MKPQQKPEQDQPKPKLLTRIAQFLLTIFITTRADQEKGETENDFKHRGD